ncbi:MAG: putative quinol monooxygenase [Sphingomonadales bacterium]|jgi:quinol monooxygenase YgiN
MIIVIGRIAFDPAQYDRIEPAIRRMMQATWAESGCLSYSIAVEDPDEGIGLVVERWASADDLKAHFATPHMAAFNAAIEGAILGMDVKVYDAGNERALSDL